MYKYLIIAIAGMFTLAGAYYINTSGGGQLLVNAFTSEKPDTFVPISPESVIGVYICDGKSGCTDKYILLLKDDKSAEMTLLPEAKGAPSNEKKVMTQSDRNPKTQNDTTNTATDTQFSTSNEPLSVQTDVVTPGLTTPETPTDTDTSRPQDTPKSTDAGGLHTTDNGDSNSTYTIDKGSWSIGVQNMLVITMNEQGTSTYEVPQKIVVKNVGASTLSRISFTKSIYTSMIHPTFTKQE